MVGCAGQECVDCGDPGRPAFHVLHPACRVQLEEGREQIAHVPVYLVGRFCGFNRNESSILGILMNTRALMELIVLNIGFDLGLIPQKVFTMLVIMAVITTLMAGPLLKRLLSNAGHTIPAGLEA